MRIPCVHGLITIRQLKLSGLEELKMDSNLVLFNISVWFWNHKETVHCLQFSQLLQHLKMSLGSSSQFVETDVLSTHGHLHTAFSFCFFRAFCSEPGTFCLPCQLQRNHTGSALPSLLSSHVWFSLGTISCMLVVSHTRRHERMVHTPPWAFPGIHSIQGLQAGMMFFGWSNSCCHLGRHFCLFSFRERAIPSCHFWSMMISSLIKRAGSSSCLPALLPLRILLPRSPFRKLWETASFPSHEDFFLAPCEYMDNTSPPQVIFLPQAN